MLGTWISTFKLSEPRIRLPSIVVLLRGSISPGYSTSNRIFETAQSAIWKFGVIEIDAVEEMINVENVLSSKA